MISVGVNSKTNVGLGVPRTGTFDQKATLQEAGNKKDFTKRLNLLPSNYVLAASTIGEEVAT